MKEARAGYYAARVAADTLESMFLVAVAKPGIGHQKAARVGGTARSEWRGILAWAVAQANVADLDEVRRRIAEKVPDQLADPDGGDGYRRNALEDAHLSQRIADDWLTGHYCWAAGLGWMKWDRRRWKHISDAAITEVVRKAHRKYAADEVARGADVARIKALAGLLYVSKIRAVVSLARGIVEVESDQFDQHPDLLNVGNGIIDLATGKLGLHDPALYLTKITAVDYRPEAHHDDWARALTALPADVATWMQLRFGQAASGHMAPDDVMPVLRGSGANGKSTIVKAIHAALGDHAVVIPDRVLLANPGDHPTEMMTLRGARLALLEELPEGRHLNVKRLKDTVGTSPITARAIAKDNITWAATHTLMLTTNYLPLVDEVDHGTWRRLALVEFPFTFSDDAAPDSATDRSKVEGLRERLADGAGGRAKPSSPGSWQAHGPGTTSRRSCRPNQRRSPPTARSGEPTPTGSTRTSPIGSSPNAATTSQPPTSTRTS
jgi:P4 family phage/plasmid primase-like protien